MATADCWRCASKLNHIIEPVSRREECGACTSDIHVCKMCIHYQANNRTGYNEER
ncbi:MAG: hypothetical protein ACI88A_005021 [Paraglaciecola sp.]|jgi:hypothetical protein